MIKIEVQVKETKDSKINVKLSPMKVPKTGATQNEKNTGQVIFNEIGNTLNNLSTIK